MQLSNRMAMLLACLTLALPQAVKAADAATDTNKGAKIQDISLRDDGVLLGHVVDAQGGPVAAAKVTVVYDGQVIARTVSNRDGEYIVRKLRGGVHSVVAGDGAAAVRLWTRQAAPPSCRSTLTIVSDRSIVRGQCGDPECGGECGVEGCCEPDDGGCCLFGGNSCLFGGGMAGTAGVVATAAIVGGVLAVALDDDDDPAS